jgi:hypothetical protein
VDHRADHERQPRPILEEQQGASAGHVHLLHRPAVLQEDLDENVRHGIGVLPNLIDILLSKACTGILAGRTYSGI